ncbi:estradiol 17-beta-dehydrogenase 2 isoform X1 [Sebastes umbrosus]|uniref:estradiol 17-beta-dehydrogenase 2 isoform X1 n=1 Tax=Sebastes umbrosus TaxID=72105 RepID=UPI00189C608B|nr:estradiol 17-beta-dehydrogenase 2 isoform X1 [Sebastes umbrosus]
MDITSCFCGVAAAVFFLTVLWRFKEGCGAGNWPGTFGALGVGGALGGGAALYFTVPPVVCVSAALLGYSLVLICDTERRVELLQSRAVLITGCDSGFGLALATRLSEVGVKVFAGVLDVNGAGARQLRERGSENLQVLQLDVTDGSQIEAAHRYICTQVADTGLWGLVNNAGVLLCPVDAELQPMTAYRLCMDVNFLSAVKMCQVFLPLLRRSRGRIVNMSSLAGEVPMPRLAAYGASKAALSVFSKVMRLELSMWGVKVALIQPAAFRTNIFGNSDDVARYSDEILTAVSSDAREDYGDTYISSLPRSLSRMSRQCAKDLSPVVDDVCHALLSVRPKPMYTPGKMGWLLPFLHRCSPTAVFDAVITTLTEHADCKPAGLNRS